MINLKVNIISDGDVTTNVLLRQVFGRISDEESVRVLYVESLMLEDLSSGINVFCRNCLPSAAWIPVFLNKNNIPYIYYIDDNLWELHDGTLLADYHSSPNVISTLNTFVEHASQVITSTIRLKNYILEKELNKLNNVISLPNFIDFSIFNSVHRPFKSSDNNRFRIGYAGSAKQKAFEPVLCALQEVRSLGWDFSVEFVGFKPNSELMIDKYYPYSNSYKDYISLVSELNWDLALAPFLDDYFWSFKSDNKYREYSALRVPAVYSNLAPYNDVITDGVNGFLVENTVDAWKDKIIEILDNKFDLAVVSSAAYSDAFDKYDISNVSKVWMEHIDLNALCSGGVKIHIWQRIYFYCKARLPFGYIMFLINFFFVSIKKKGFVFTLKRAINFLKKKVMYSIQ